MNVLESDAVIRVTRNHTHPENAFHHLLRAHTLTARGPLGAHDGTCGVGVRSAARDVVFVPVSTLPALSSLCKAQWATNHTTLTSPLSNKTWVRAAALWPWLLSGRRPVEEEEDNKSDWRVLALHTEWNVTMWTEGFPVKGEMFMCFMSPRASLYTRSKYNNWSWCGK